MSNHSGDAHDAVGFVDIHCHILPGVDDGAQNLAEAVAMLRAAHAQGTQAIVTTPHNLPRSPAGSPLEESERRVGQLTRAGSEAGLNVTLLTGQEVRITNSLLNNLENGSSLKIGPTRYVLTEPPFNSMPEYVEEQIEEIIALGYRPVIAHPERNTIIQDHLDIVEDFVAAGALMQINTGSLLGHYGPGPKEAAEFLLQDSMAHVLATDAHGATGNRVPNMRLGYEAAARLVGEYEALNLTRDNPLAIIEGREVPYQPSVKGVEGFSDPYWRGWEGVGLRLICAVCGARGLAGDHTPAWLQPRGGKPGTPWHCIACRNGALLRWRYCNRCGKRTRGKDLLENGGRCDWCISVDTIPWEEPAT